jgi:hypothetical protein
MDGGHTSGTFPFGSPIRPLVQRERHPTRVFILGVYASAVHARWLAPDGRQLVRALAVDSEPEIFWRGEGASDLIKSIDVPPEVGRLEPCGPDLNGPSGRTLDALYLDPLGLTRAEAWLADLLPESRVNPQQQRAIAKVYQPLADRGLVPRATVPPVPSRFADDARREALLDELVASKAGVLITLGDPPLRDFVSQFDRRYRRLALLGATEDAYGSLREVKLAGHPVQLLALVHPRQAGRLGASSALWSRLHRHWAASSSTRRLCRP